MWKVILLPETFLTSQVVYESPKNDNFRSIELVRTFWRHFEGSCSKYKANIGKNASFGFKCLYLRLGSSYFKKLGQFWNPHVISFHLSPRSPGLPKSISEKIAFEETYIAFFGGVTCILTVEFVWVTLFICNFLRVAWTKSKYFCDRKKAEDLRIPKLPLHISISASRQEIWAFKHKTSVFQHICFVLWAWLFKVAPIRPHHRFEPNFNVYDTLIYIWTGGKNFRVKNKHFIKADFCQTNSGFKQYWALWLTE